MPSEKIPTPARDVIAEKELRQVAEDIAALENVLSALQQDVAVVPSVSQSETKRVPKEMDAGTPAHVVHNEARHWPAPGKLLE